MDAGPVKPVESAPWLEYPSKLLIVSMLIQKYAEAVMTIFVYVMYI